MTPRRTAQRNPDHFAKLKLADVPTPGHCCAARTMCITASLGKLASGVRDRCWRHSAPLIDARVCRWQEPHSCRRPITLPNSAPSTARLRSLTIARFPSPFLVPTGFRAGKRDSSRHQQTRDSAGIAHRDVFLPPPILPVQLQEDAICCQLHREPVWACMS